MKGREGDHHLPPAWCSTWFAVALGLFLAWLGITAWAIVMLVTEVTP